MKGYRGGVVMSEGYLKQYLYKKGSSRGIPVSGTFELTDRCNLGCRMCYIHTQGQDKNSLQKELTSEQWLDIGRQAVDAGMIYLLLTGGEPTLRVDFAQIYEGMARMGVLISVNTNGVFLPPNLLELFKRHPPEKVNITLYGMSSDTYGELCRNAPAFHNTIRNILLLKDAGINVNLNTTFTRANVKDMEQIVAFAQKEAIPIRTASYLFPPACGADNSGELFLEPDELGALAAKFDWLTMTPDKLLQRAEMIQTEWNTTKGTCDMACRASACTAGRGSFWITADGKMRPCGMLHSDVNVTQRSFSDAWRQTQKNIKSYLLPKECISCKYKSVCPSCVAVSAEEDGSSGALQEKMCIRTKAYTSSLLTYATMNQPEK